MKLIPILTVIFTLLFIAPSQLKASHAAGAELTYECLGGNQYRITLKFYRDCGGITPSNTSINYTGCGGSGTLNTTQTSLIEVTPLCPTATSDCNSGTVTGYTEYVYEATITLPAGCDDWVFTYCENARNSIIDVINAPGSQDLCVQTMINNLDAPCNDSPTFSNQPVSFLCANTPYCMNPGAVDPEGDSLVYSMITPLESPTGGTVSYNTPYGPNNPLPTTAGGPFTLNPQTGDICFTASGPIVSVMAVRVDQYDANGTLIGYIIRDIQVNVSNCSNQNPTLLGYDGNPIAPDGSNTSLDICPGDVVNQIINAVDIDDVGTALTLSWNGALPGGIFTDNGDGTATLSWTPSAAQAGQTICFTVTAEDDQCPYVGSNTNSYCITVNSGTISGTLDTIQICGNLTAQLDAQYGNTFTWTVLNGEPIVVGTNFTCNPCANPVASPTITTTYIVTSDLPANGFCGNSDTVTVEIVPSLGDLTVDAGPDQNICLGQCAGLVGTANQVIPPPPPATFSATPNAYIDDNTPVTSTINVTGLNMTNISAGSIESVCLNINHGAASELDIFLECPDGTMFELSTDNGGNNNDYNGTCFTISAVTAISAGAAPFNGDFIPEGGPLNNAMVGCTANGNWTLHVSDDRGDYNCFLGFCDNDDGTVLDWSITFNDDLPPNSLTHAWTPAADMNDATILDPNVCPPTAGSHTYTLTSTDINGCFDTSSVIVNVAGSFDIDSTITPVTCFGSDGEIDITPNGGIAPYTFVWTAVPSGTAMGTTEDLIGLDAGQYEVVITDQNGLGCVVTDTIAVPTDINIPVIDSTTIIDETCLGMLDGGITVHFSGGVGAPIVTIFLGGIQVDQNATGVFTDLAPGTYDIEVAVAGCIVTGQAIVKAGPDISFTYATQPTACGANNGQIILTPSGGAGYNFSIENGANPQTDSTFNGIAAGAYIGWVEDIASGCIYSEAINVSNISAQVFVSIDSNAASCNGICDGSFTVHMSGGSLPINFSIDGGNNTQTDSTFTGLCADTLDIWTEDQIGCVATSQVIIVEPDAIIFDADSIDVSCNGFCDGEINISSVNGGDGNYQYSVDEGSAVIGPQAGTNFSGMCANTYTVIVEDGNGCTATSNIEVVEPIALSMVFTPVDAICNGDCNGSAEANISGGLTPYTFAWSAGLTVQNDSTVIDVCAGTYDLTVTDVNGCTIDTIGFVINENPPMTIQNTVIVDEFCSGACDGSITVNAVTALQFSNNGGQTYQAANVFNSMCPGNYDISVLDVDGCQHDTTVNVGSVNPIDISTVPDTLICIGGTADLTANSNGGTGTFTYTWTEVGSGIIAGQTGATISVNPTVTTSYEVFATDANGCTSPTATIVVNVHLPINAQAFSSQTICAGDTVDFWGTANGGDGNLLYTWVTNFGDTLYGNTQFGTVPMQTITYTLTVTDGCGTPPSSALVTMTVNPMPEVTFTTIDTADCLPVDYRMQNTTVVQGACFWQFGNGITSTDCNPTVTINSAGCFDATLTVTTPEGCESDTTIVDYLCAYPYPEANFLFEPQVPTTAYTTVEFENLSEDATSYAWTFGDGTGSNEENPVHTFPDEEAGEYPVYLVAYNEYGCTDTAYSKVTVRDEFIMYVPNAFTPDDDEFNEIFKPIITSGFQRDSYELSMYNRWGELLFVSRNSEVGWDGRYKGNIVQDGVYVWKISLKDSFTDERKEFQGHVTLIR